jgi:hypothetical protein
VDIIHVHGAVSKTGFQQQTGVSFRKNMLFAVSDGYQFERSWWLLERHLQFNPEKFVIVFFLNIFHVTNLRHFKLSWQ